MQARRDETRRDETTKIVDENPALQQAFLNDLDEKLWSSADKLRQQLDAANYKHIVLGLIFLKYISDSLLIAVCIEQLRESVGKLLENAVGSMIKAEIQSNCFSP